MDMMVKVGGDAYLDARMVSLWGDHWTWKISSLCDSKLCSFSFRFLKKRKTMYHTMFVAQVFDWWYGGITGIKHTENYVHLDCNCFRWKIRRIR